MKTRLTYEERAGVDIRTIDRWMKIGILPRRHTRTGRVRIPASAVDQATRVDDEGAA